MASSQVVISRRQNLWGRTVAQLSRDFGVWLYVGAVLSLVTVLAFVYLAQASYVARQIEDMVMLEHELDDVHEVNSALSLRIAKYEDMPRIKTEAKAMGLGEATRVEYLEVVVDDAGPGSQGDVIQNLPTGAIGGNQQSGLSQSGATYAVGGLRVAPTIAQQFQGWIGRGTAQRDAD
jgi:hypothetical protein